MKIRLDHVSKYEWKRFAKQTAKRLIKNGLADGRKRHIGDYSHRRLDLKFGQQLPKKQHILRFNWFDLVNAELKKLKNISK